MTITISTITDIPTKRGGSRKSAYPVEDLALPVVGEDGKTHYSSFVVPSESVGAVRSIVRARRAVNPALDVKTRAEYVDGKPTGNFLVYRGFDIAPTAPATPVAETPAS